GTTHVPAPLVFSHRSGRPRVPLSFPTRRSSDLRTPGSGMRGARRPIGGTFELKVSDTLWVSDTFLEGIGAHSRRMTARREWAPIDRKSTRLNSSHVKNLVCRLLLEKKKSQDDD